MVQFCLTRMLRSIQKQVPTPAMVAAIAKGMQAFDNSPCMCTGCGQTQLAVAKYLLPGVVAPDRPERDPDPGDGSEPAVREGDSLL